MHRRRSLLSLLAAALLVVPLSACAMGSGSSGVPDLRSSEAAAGSTSGPSVATDAGAAVTEDGMVDPGSAIAGTSIIRNGDLSVTVADPETAAEEVATIAEGLGGYIESQSVSAGGDGLTANASLAVRVPADQIDAAFEALAKVGDVTSQNRSSTDVTTQHVDLKARVAALEESVQRLTELMSESATTGELIEAEAALSQRQQELDGLTAQLTALEDQVDEATIWVSLSTKNVVVPGGPTTFWDGLLAGLGSISAAGAGALVVLGILLPWLVLGGVIALIVVLIVRRARRRRAARGSRGPGGAGPTAPVPAPVLDPAPHTPAAAAAPVPPAQQW